MTDDRFERPPTTDRGKCQHPLGLGEAVADALVRTASEGEVGVPGPVRVDPVPEPAGRVKTFRVRPPLRVAMDDPLAQQQRRAGRQPIASDKTVFQQIPTHAPHRRVKPHRLGEHRVGIRQVRQIRDRRPPAGQDGVELGVQRCRDLRMRAEQMKCPGQRVGRGFVTGQHDGQDLIADLGVVHPVAGLRIAGRQQQ